MSTSCQSFEEEFESAWRVFEPLATRLMTGNHRNESFTAVYHAMYNLVVLSLPATTRKMQAFQTDHIKSLQSEMILSMDSVTDSTLLSLYCDRWKTFMSRTRLFEAACMYLDTHNTDQDRVNRHVGAVVDLPPTIFQFWLYLWKKFIVHPLKDRLFSALSSVAKGLDPERRENANADSVEVSINSLIFCTNYLSNAGERDDIKVGLSKHSYTKQICILQNMLGF